MWGRKHHGGEKRAFVGESVIFSVERWNCGGENVIVWGEQ